MSIKTLLERHSIRNYDPNYEIPEELLSKIVQAALNSPTAMNRQDIDLVVCTNCEKLQAITNEIISSGPEGMRERLLERQKNAGMKNPVTYDCSCVIFLVKSERAADYTNVDAEIVAMSIMIAAKAEGLDSVCLGSIKMGLNEKTQSLLELNANDVIVGVGIGKARKGAEIHEKEIIAKVKYVK